MRRMLLATLFVLPLAGCGKSSSPAGPSDRVLTFPSIHAEAQQEIVGKCESFTLNNDQPIYVNDVEMAAGPGWHHSNWFYVKDTDFAGPDGEWNCADRGFDEVAAGGRGGVLFAQSTQSQGESQQFPAGAALKLPAHARVVGGIHIVNASTQAIDTTITLTLKTIPEHDVTVSLHPMSLEYHPLDLPPNARSRFTGTCTPSDNAPLDFKVYYVLPHYHNHGTALSFRAFGPAGTTTIFDQSAPIGNAWGETLDPPIDVNGQSGITFSCDYENNTDAPLYWGNADGEMCVLLAYTDSPYKWVGGVFTDNAVVGTDGDGVVLNQGPCLFGWL